MVDEERVRQLLWNGKTETKDRRRTKRALMRARRQVGQQDTVSFLLIRIWAALASMLAPFFAKLTEKQASVGFAASQRDSAKGPLNHDERP